jgi:hypothetical protein
MFFVAQPAVAAGDASVQHAPMQGRESRAETASAGARQAPWCHDGHQLGEPMGHAAVVAAAGR